MKLGFKKCDGALVALCNALCCTCTLCAYHNGAHEDMQCMADSISGGIHLGLVSVASLIVIWDLKLA